MPDTGLTRQDPLAGRSHRDDSRQVTLEASPAGTVLQVVFARPGEVGDERLRAVAALAGLSVRVSPPLQAWLVGESAMPGEAVRTVAAALGAGATVIDQSHGRTRIALTGPGARRVLSAGTAVDVSDRAFPVDASAETLFAAIPVTVTRVADERYELLVGRSFALSLWHELLPEGAA